jgi:cytidylate kinase
MNLVFAGLHGTGKSTIAKSLANTYHFTYYSTGYAFRDLAKEKEMTLEQFSQYAETHLEIDKELDHKILTLAKTGDNYIFDGQLPAYLLGPLADYSIMLQCDDHVRITRMTLRDAESYDVKLHETLMREESERQRFIQLYNIDIHNPTLITQTYQLILDTTPYTIAQILALCQTALEQHFPSLISLRSSSSSPHK